MTHPQATAQTPTALEQSFRDICARHNVHSVSINLLTPNDRCGAGWSVGLQRWDGDEPIPGACWHGSGKSIATALTAAIAEIPRAASFADEALPIELAA